MIQADQDLIELYFFKLENLKVKVEELSSEVHEDSNQLKTKLSWIASTFIDSFSNTASEELTVLVNLVDEIPSLLQKLHRSCNTLNNIRDSTQHFNNSIAELFPNSNHENEVSVLNQQVSSNYNLVSAEKVLNERQTTVEILNEQQAELRVKDSINNPYVDDEGETIKSNLSEMLNETIPN